MSIAGMSVDFDARYSVEGYGGVAWYLLEFDTEWTEESWEYSGEGDMDDESSYIYSEPEEIQNTSRVKAVMVGDDSIFTFGIEEINLISDEDYCHECGQIGCKGDGR